jgi:drug/metabolite transporter (DMT)-like permease
MEARAVWGNFLALCGALAVSGYLIIGRKVRVKMSLIPFIFLVYGISAIVLNLFMLASKQSPFGYSANAYTWIFLLAVIPQLIGHSLFNWLLKYLSATMVAVTTLSEPIGSALLAYIFLKEAPAFAVMIGGALILSGIYLTSRQNTKPNDKQIVEQQ